LLISRSSLDPVQSFNGLFEPGCSSGLVSLDHFIRIPS
jgi:hypothetical protein